MLKKLWIYLLLIVGINVLCVSSMLLLLVTMVFSPAIALVKLNELPK